MIVPAGAGVAGVRVFGVPVFGVPVLGVVGHPVAHSLSPEIHAAFAREVGIAIDYRRILAPLDDFDGTVDRFFADGGRGLNVTVPFKLEAFARCGARVDRRADEAGAVNVIRRDADGLYGDNTDGIGLVEDLKRLDVSLADARVLLIGAGGAARGAIGPLLDGAVRSLTIVNRDVRKARSLVERFAHPAMSVAATFATIGDAPFDLVVNATSVGLSPDALPLPLPTSTLADAALVYDMMYGSTPTAFLVVAERAGARRTADGLGMLVEQAAESFRLWFGVRPQTPPVLQALRTRLQSGRPS